MLDVLFRIRRRRERTKNHENGLMEVFLSSKTKET
jgi:hypothetical protein